MFLDENVYICNKSRNVSFLYVTNVPSRDTQPPYAATGLHRMTLRQPTQTTDRVSR